MPKSALSERLQTKENWEGTDWDNPFQKWMIPLKGWFAYGPRAKEWWAKWREYPKTIFAILGKGSIRIENEDWERDSAREYSDPGIRHVLFNLEPVMFYEFGKLGTVMSQGYLSRVQYYTRWSFQIQWPFMIAFHIYFKPNNVQIYGKPRNDTDGKLFFFYFGAHRDADKVYWFPSAYVGFNWK